MPASAVNVVEPSATVSACHSICFTFVDPPNETLEPFIVTAEFDNLAFVNVPGAISAAKTVEFSILSVVTASSAIPVF